MKQEDDRHRRGTALSIDGQEAVTPAPDDTAAQNPSAHPASSEATPQNAKENAPASPAAARTPEPPKPEKKVKRTVGQKLFDFFLYPLLTNVAVFVISVLATYLTTKGDNHGAFGKFMMKRGIWLKEKLMKMGVSEKMADMGKMVGFSFLDGSLMAPVVKVFEDHSDDIAKKIDKTLGTEPPDDTPYQAQPKQSWWSVLGGRAVTFSIVFPTYLLLSKWGKDLQGAWKWKGAHTDKEFRSLNDMWFTEWGEKIGEYLKDKPIAKWFGKYDVEELGKVSIFEAFYTSVCTAGLYIFSRAFARSEKTHAEKEAAKHAAPPVPTDTLPAGEMPLESSLALAVADAPRSRITQAETVEPALHEGHLARA